MMRIGSLELISNLFLSPLAGYTNLPFRLTVREIGGLGLATTDLVNARSLLERNPKALKLIETRPADQPLAVQLFGAVPEEMRDAAVLLESRGVAAVDVNMGCPVRKVCRVGGGSAMMTEFTSTARLVAGMVDHVKIPVTAKMRLGWDDDNLTAPDLARALEDVGRGCRVRSWPDPGARVRRQGQPRRHPRRGPGGPPHPGDRQWRCHHRRGRRSHVSRNRVRRRQHRPGRFYNPWIFQHTLRFLGTGTTGRRTRLRGTRAGHAPTPRLDGRGLRGNPRLPDVPQSGALVCPPLRALPSLQPPRGPAHHRRGVRRDPGRIPGWRKQFCDDQGELLPRFQPAPLVASLWRRISQPLPGAIPVPKGPVEIW
jgi:tRNA-dihydrouridine synthase B